MNYAVVNIGKIRFSGYLAWLFWNAVHLFKIVGLKKQVQVAIDWMLATMFPRDAMIIRRPRRCPSVRTRAIGFRTIQQSHWKSRHRGTGGLTSTSRRD